MKEHSSGKIVFVSERGGDAEIYVIEADSSNQTRLIYNQTSDIDSSWGP